ncbi:MAG: acyltransferase [Bacteroidales bacterium]|nr:acyltransferase [Bacteroidales bacterium]
MGFAYCLLAFVVPYFIIFAPSQTSASWHYQRRRLHRGVLRSLVGLYSHYFNFGQALIDKMAMTAGAAGSFSFEYDNYDKALEIVGRHEGAIFIGAHIGNWEVASHFFGEYGKDISVVMYQNEDRDIKKLLEEMYGTLPFKPIAINVDPLGAMLEIKASLNSGGYVCFDGDRYVDRNSAVPREFLGGKVMIPEGPYRIASKCRVPVIFFYAMREKGRRYRFIFEEMPLGSFKGPDGLIDAYLDSLADKVKRYPMQWFNFYDFWED